MNNEPVAWLGKDYDGFKTDLYFEVERNKLPYRLYETAIPLYTHPVKEQLTDEEFDNIFAHGKRLGVLETEDRFRKAMKLTDEEKWEVFTNLARSPDLRADMIRFADSILRKAQEK